MPRGRPTIYSQELADTICIRIATGESARKVCEDPAMPEMQTLWRWLREKQDFSEQYVRAKLESSDALAEDIQDIASKTLNGMYDPKAAHVAIDAYKWTASKLKPKKYGDKLDLTSGGEKLPQPIFGGTSAISEHNSDKKGLSTQKED